jgi:hypothetical protein
LFGCHYGEYPKQLLCGCKTVLLYSSVGIFCGDVRFALYYLCNQKSLCVHLNVVPIEMIDCYYGKYVRRVMPPPPECCVG